MEQGPRRKKKRGLPKNIKNPVLVKCEILNNVSDIKFNLEEHKLVVEPRTLKLKSRFP